MADGWDAAAFEALFRAHYAGLCGFVYRFVRSRESAEELVQDLFAALWRQRHQLEVRSSVKAYLYRGARNRALNWLEHEGLARSWVERETPAGEPAAPHAQLPDAQLESLERRTHLERALDTLPVRCRATLRLRYVEQLSHAEIAEVMGISLKGVENQLARGLKALRRTIPPETI